MDRIPSLPPSPADRMNSFWQRGVRFMTRVAIAFGLSVATAILLAAAVADNALVQILVMVLASVGFWIPFLFLILGLERFFSGRRGRARRVAEPRSGGDAKREEWRRLTAVAPAESERLSVLQRSLERSRLTLGKADLDPGAHDLCVLIDRRLPELIHRELDNLAPDDRNRRRQVGELIELIEQFARHCSRERLTDSDEPAFEAAVLRRRFEDRLSGL